jgi:hypothetical protein
MGRCFGTGKLIVPDPQEKNNQKHNKNEKFRNVKIQCDYDTIDRSGNPSG